MSEPQQPLHPRRFSSCAIGFGKRRLPQLRIGGRPQKRAVPPPTTRTKSSIADQYDSSWILEANATNHRRRLAQGMSAAKCSDARRENYVIVGIAEPAKWPVRPLSPYTLTNDFAEMATGFQIFERRSDSCISNASSITGRILSVRSCDHTPNIPDGPDDHPMNAQSLG